MLTGEEAAAIAGISYEVFKRHGREGKIKTKKIWREIFVDERELRFYLIGKDKCLTKIYCFIEKEAKYIVKYMCDSLEGKEGKKFDESFFRGSIFSLIRTIEFYKVPMEEELIMELDSLLITVI